MCVCASRASSLKRRCRPYKGTLTSPEGGGHSYGPVGSARHVRVDVTPQRRVEKHEPPDGSPLPPSGGRGSVLTPTLPRVNFSINPVRSVGSFIAVRTAGGRGYNSRCREVIFSDVSIRFGPRLPCASPKRRSGHDAVLIIGLQSFPVSSRTAHRSVPVPKKHLRASCGQSHLKGRVPGSCSSHHFACEPHYVR